MPWAKRQINEEMKERFPHGTVIMVKDYPEKDHTTRMTVTWSKPWMKPLGHLVPVGKHDDHYMCVPLDRIM
jgi:hypothetical protein